MGLTHVSSTFLTLPFHQLTSSCSEFTGQPLCPLLIIHGADVLSLFPSMYPSHGRTQSLDQLHRPVFLPTFRMLFATVPIILNWLLIKHWNGSLTKSGDFVTASSFFGTLVITSENTLLILHSCLHLKFRWH